MSDNNSEEDVKARIRKEEKEGWREDNKRNRRGKKEDRNDLRRNRRRKKEDKKDKMERE
ncbi:hypothetical protein SK128_008214, partial [Halocaridina rubra]